MISGYDRDRSGTPEAPVGPRVRLYELAKDLGLQPKDLVAKVRAMAIDVANHMSQIEPADVDRIRRAVDRERHESLVEERLTVDGTVIRRRSKVAGRAAPRPRARSSRQRQPPPPRRPAPAAAPQPVAAPPPVRAPEPVVVAKAEPVQTQPAAPAPTPPVEVRPAAPVEAPAPPPPAAEAAPAAPAAPAISSKPIEMPVPQPLSRAGLRTIPQPVVTGSAATGAFIQLPGLAPRGDAPTRRASRSRTATRSCAASAAATCSTARPPDAIVSAARRSVPAASAPAASPRSGSPPPARS